MTSAESEELATIVCGAFRAGPETVAAYTIAFKDYRYDFMKEAVNEAMAAYDKMPSVKTMIGLYRKAEAERRGDVETADPKCEYCAQVGVDRDSVPPYTGRQRYSDDDGNDRGAVWLHRPACGTHGREKPMSKPTRDEWYRGDDVAFEIGMSMRLPGINDATPDEIERLTKIRAARGKDTSPKDYTARVKPSRDVGNISGAVVEVLREFRPDFNESDYRAMTGGGA